MKLLPVFVFCLIVGLASAQNPTAAISGQVSDSSGAAVSGAKVTVVNPATNIAHDATTNNEGLYTVPLLPPSSYQITVERSGFNTEIRSGVTLQVGQEARIDFSLKVGDSKQQVEVSAEAPLLDTEGATVGTVIDNKKVVELPLNGRAFWSLALLVPGVYQSTTNNNVRGGMNVAGMGDGANNYTLDGINNNDFSIGQPSYRPSVDAIQEFKVYTGTYEAQFGHSSGGQVVVTGKSGTNTVHGTLFEFLRNQKLDAVNFFTPPGITPAYKRNQFGGTAGGPVQKNKTFFFFSYEGLRLRQQLTALSTVPLPAMLAGDFSGIPTVLKVPAGYAASAIVNNVINPSALTPAQLQANIIGKALLGYYPAPTRPTIPGTLPSNNYSFSQTAQETSNQYSLRLDHSIDSKNSLFATLNYVNDSSINYLTSDSACGGPALPGFPCLAGVLAQLYGAGFTHVFSPTFVNEFRGGFQREVTPRYGIGPEAQTDFNGTYGIPANFGGVDHNLGIPSTAITGYTTLGDPTSVPQYRADNTFDVVDDMIWSFGKHNVKFGFQATRQQNNSLLALSGRGVLNFTGTNQGPTTGYPLADALLGLPATTKRIPTAPKVELRTTYFAGYIQDTYKVTQRFTLNYGLRWEDVTPLSNNYQSISNFDPVAGLPYVIGQSGYPTNAYSYFNTAFGPRLGFAYQPFGDQKTVLRGGAGIYYNSPIMVNGFISLETGYPARQTLNFVSTPSNPLSLPNPFLGPATGNAPAGIDRNFRMAAINEWSLGIQREIALGIVLDVSYLGSKGRHLMDTRNINQPVPTTLSTAQVQALQLYPNYGTINWQESAAISSFNALLVKGEKRYSSGLSFLMTYGFAKSLDDQGANSTNNGTIPQNSRDLVGSNYGLSAFDVRHRFVFSSVYELPFGRSRRYLTNGIASKILGNFQLSGIVTAQTSPHVTAVMSGNFSNTNNQLLGNLDRPNVVGEANNGPKTLQKYFNTGAFVAPAFGTFGNEGVSTIATPSLVNFDIALARNFSLPRESALQFRLETFNTVNHPNFQAPGVIVNTSTFGTITAANAPRDIQLALKLIF